MKPDPLKQAAKDAKVIHAGARLHVALQTPQGHIFVEEMLNFLDESVQKLLLDPITSEAQILSVLYEARGVMGRLQVMGDKVDQARRVSVKRAAENALRMTKEPEEES